MNLLDFKNKLIKGKELGGEVVYIKEDNLLYGIESIYKNRIFAKEIGWRLMAFHIFSVSLLF